MNRHVLSVEVRSVHAVLNVGGVAFCKASTVVPEGRLPVNIELKKTVILMPPSVDIPVISAWSWQMRSRSKSA